MQTKNSQKRTPAHDKISLQTRGGGSFPGQIKGIQEKPADRAGSCCPFMMPLTKATLGLWQAQPPGGGSSKPSSSREPAECVRCSAPPILAWAPPSPASQLRHLSAQVSSCLLSPGESGWVVLLCCVRAGFLVQGEVTVPH